MIARRHIFLGFFALGTILPTFAITMWLARNGGTPLDVVAFVYGSWAGFAFLAQVFICAFSLVTAFHNRVEGKRLAAIAIMLTFFGPSSGLPLYFYFRELDKSI